MHLKHESALFLVWLAFLGSAYSAEPNGAPGKNWERWESPGAAGWDEARVARAGELAKSMSASAVVVVSKGRILLQTGQPERVLPIHSVRKSILSALFGNAIAGGRLRTSQTLAQLGIDDKRRLTESEKKATVADLMKARSGIYLPSAMASASMLKNLPARGAHPPGAHWYYNNWDFNALGTIYRQATGRNVFEAFATEIAAPTGMEHFDLKRHTEWIRDRDSEHAGYSFRMSALDMARFGHLMLKQGTWNGKQLIPASWVKESTSAWTDFQSQPGINPAYQGGYGYMWWVEVQGRHIPGMTVPTGSFSAQGYGGHMILVAPPLDTVVVIRARTDLPDWMPGSRLEPKAAAAFLKALLER